jgi:exodeoxyribonuclease VII small subunit
MDEPELGFDQILVRLRDVVGRLESGELTLEQSLQIYEQGVQLARRGQQLLVSAEQRVEILVSASGHVEAVPFDAAAGKAGAAPTSHDAAARGMARPRGDDAGNG